MTALNSASLFEAPRSYEKYFKTDETEIIGLSGRRISDIYPDKGEF
jgi:hypothetical protein